MGGETGVRGGPSSCQCPQRHNNLFVASSPAAWLVTALPVVQRTSGSRPGHFDGFQPARPFVAGVLPGTTQTVAGRDTTSRLSEAGPSAVRRACFRASPSSSWVSGAVPSARLSCFPLSCDRPCVEQRFGHGHGGQACSTPTRGREPLAWRAVVAAAGTAQRPHVPFGVKCGSRRPKWSVRDADNGFSAVPTPRADCLGRDN